jgi:rubredoxin
LVDFFGSSALRTGSDGGCVPLEEAKFPLHGCALPALIPPLKRTAASRGRCDCSMKTYMCVICGYVYEEEKGDAAAGIAAGTRWDDVPLSWRCPDCGAGKEDFEMVEV